MTIQITFLKNSSGISLIVYFENTNRKYIFGYFPGFQRHIADKKIKLNGLRAVFLGNKYEAVPFIGFLLSLAPNSDHQQKYSNKSYRNDRFGKNGLQIFGPPDIARIYELSHLFAPRNIKYEVNPGISVQNNNDLKHHTIDNQILKIDSIKYHKDLYDHMTSDLELDDEHRNRFTDRFFVSKSTEENSPTFTADDRAQMVSNYILFPEDHQGTLNIGKLLKNYPNFPMQRCKDLKRGQSVTFEVKNDGILENITVYPSDYVAEKKVCNNILILEDVSVLTDLEMQKNGLYPYFSAQPQFKNLSDTREPPQKCKQIDKIICVGTDINWYCKRLMNLSTAYSNSRGDLQSIEGNREKTIRSQIYNTDSNDKFHPRHFLGLITSGILLRCEIIKIKIDRQDYTSSSELTRQLHAKWDIYNPSVENFLYGWDQLLAEGPNVRDGDVMDLRQTRSSRSYLIADALNETPNHENLGFDSNENSGSKKSQIFETSSLFSNSKNFKKSPSPDHELNEKQLNDLNEKQLRTSKISCLKNQIGKSQITTMDFKKKTNIHLHHHFPCGDSHYIQRFIGDNVLFLGTAASIPTKYRNVAGLVFHYLTMKQDVKENEQSTDVSTVSSRRYSSFMSKPIKNHSGIEVVRKGIKYNEADKNSNTSQTVPPVHKDLKMSRYVLLDCGEDTLSQFNRIGNSSDRKERLRALSVIFISHSHADHHLGCVDLIKEWADRYQIKYDGRKNYQSWDCSYNPNVDLDTISETNDDNDSTFYLNGIPFKMNDAFKNVIYPQKEDILCSKSTNSSRKRKKNKKKRTKSKFLETDIHIEMTMRSLTVICPLRVKLFLDQFNLPVKYILTDWMDNVTEIELINRYMYKNPYRNKKIQEKQPNYSLKSCLDCNKCDKIKFTICKMDHLDDSRGIRIDVNQIQEQVEDSSVIPTTLAEARQISNRKKQSVTQRSVCYSGDTYPSAQFFDLCQNADVIIHDCTFISNIERAQKTQHSTMPQVVNSWLQSGAKQLILTHFSQRIRTILEQEHKYWAKGTKRIARSHEESVADTFEEKIQFASEGKACLIENVFIAFDFLKYEFGMPWRPVKELIMEEVDE
ncbi:putative tRNA processing endoribonuclease Trz1 [Pseudoloma neurophilia]|uniref:ribonuclease Z n=1 Tax=Pseudoloma neurophilia TaxID=146866 RepID=A0A0R0M2A8_9MICR|nr:putative tRNA processing endoribonuclease Trz1 [Pseudoloma neurophilia]